MVRTGLFKSYPNISRIDLSMNSIRFFMGGPIPLKNLREMHLWNNKLVELPADLFQFCSTSLKVLNLEYN